MSRGLLFWILMILWLIFGLWAAWPLGWGFGSTALLFILLGLLGWQVFGPVVKG
jgi:hypothetical protein